MVQSKRQRLSKQSVINSCRAEQCPEVPARACKAAGASARARFLPRDRQKKCGWTKFMAACQEFLARSSTVFSTPVWKWRVNSRPATHILSACLMFSTLHRFVCDPAPTTILCRFSAHEIALKDEKIVAQRHRERRPRDFPGVSASMHGPHNAGISFLAKQSGEAVAPPLLVQPAGMVCPASFRPTSRA